MRKTLLTALFALASLTVFAQMVGTKQAPYSLQRGNSVDLNLTQAPFMRMHKSPMRKAELASNERILGLYTTDDYEQEMGGGLPTVGKYSVLTVVPASYYQRLMDGKITAIRYALTQPCQVTRVFVSTVTSQGEVTLLGEQEVTAKTSPSGWSMVALSTPITIPDGYYGVALGFDYVQNAGASPISVISGGMEDSFVLYGDMGDGPNYYDYSSYGRLSVQAIMQCNNLPDEDVVLQDMVLSSTMLSAGSELGYAFNHYNFGSKEVSSFEIQIKLDGKLVETITEADADITATTSYCASSVTLPKDIARGKHTLSAELTKLNGRVPTTNTEDDKVTAEFTTYMASDVVARQKYLVEEMTSHSCTYCPYGAMMIEHMLEQSDSLAVACIHGNQSSKDPFNTTQCQDLLSYLGCEVFPSGAFNRIYLGDNSPCIGIGYDKNQKEYAKSFISAMTLYSTPSFATIDIEKQLEGDKLSIKVSGKGGEVASTLLHNYSLTVYIVEDSLKYRQLNLGVWTNNYIHNHVLRQVTTAINGDDIQWTSASTYENNYTIDLDPTWVKEQLTVIAFISKRQPLDKVNRGDMDVTNANALPLFEHTGGGSGSVDPDAGKTDAELIISELADDCQLMGEGLSHNARYVVGQNFAGSVPFVWDTETGKVKNYYQYERGTFHSISDNGIAVGYNGGMDGRALIVDAEGTITILPDNGGDNTQGSDAWDISADGKTIAGFYYYFEWINEESGFYATYPCIWQNGKCINLPYPTRTETGYDVDGAGIRWMSTDGKRLLGYLIDDFATWPAVLWERNGAGEYECKNISKKYFEAGYNQGKPYMIFTPCDISANGEWVSLQVQEEFNDANFTKPAPAMKMARYNVDKDKLEVLDMGTQNMSATGIADDGTLLGYTDIDGLYGRIGYLWPAGAQEAICLDDILSQVKDMPPFGANVPSCITADGKTIEGFGIDQDSNIFSYVINLDKANAIESVTMRPLHMDTDKVYNLAGQQVSRNAKGIIIVNGKKVLNR